MITLPLTRFPRGQVATRHLARGLAFGAKGQLAEARAELALDVKVILTPPCIFH
jgi:hypothetical protein